MREAGIETKHVDLEEVRAVLEEAAKHILPEQVDVLTALVDSHVALLELLRERGTTLKRLRRLFGLSKTERLRTLAKPGEAKPTEADAGSEACAEDETGSQGAESPAESAEPEPRTRNGGRRAADDYAGPETHVPHATLRPGDLCPDCPQGKVYPARPKVLVVIRGRAPLEAAKFRLESLRCNACGHVFHAEPPEEAKGPKYRASALAILASLHYTFGMPFHRQEEFQRSIGVPIAASTQWKLMDEAEPLLRPVYEALRRQAAASRLFHIDDTYLQILQPMLGELLRRPPEPLDPNRTGLFSTGILSVETDGRRVALFMTGRKHAGENIVDLIKLRPPDLPPPILMSDALSRNVSGVARVLMIYLAHCLAHARRGVVDQIENYPEYAEHILSELAKVFHNDRRTRELEMSPRSRRTYHRKHSRPILTRLKRWIHRVLNDRTIEPNSDMAHALRYFLRHWRRLTLFLRQPDAPLTNNPCERLLKVPIRYRKNSYFYKNARGAEVGDLYMALTATAMLNDKSPVDYLTALLEHPQAVAAHPEAWLPWTYENTCARLQEQASEARTDPTAAVA